MSKPLLKSCPNPCLNPTQSIATAIAQIEISVLDSDWLIPDHPISISKFPPNPFLEK